VLYLAEVKKGGVFGGKAELKLLACQRADSWSAIPNEEVIPAEEANSFNSGVLVLVDLTPSKQIQKLRQDTPGELLKILQSFSRQIERYKKESEEIEQWKQSLMFQSEELQRREEETQGKLEQLEQIHAESEKLAQERQEMESVRAEASKLQAELDKNRQELDTAWEQLRQQQAEFEQTGKLDPAQAQHLQELVDYLTQTTISVESVNEPLNLAFEILSNQQSALAEYQQRLENHRQTAEQQQQAVDSQSEALLNRWQAWHEAQKTLNQQQADLKVQQSSLLLKQDSALMLRHYLQEEYELQESLKQVGGSNPVNVSENPNWGELEKMPLESLPSVVLSLQQDLQNLFPFVIGQVEELVEEQRNNQQEAYQMLYETLVGQWRNLLQLQGKLTQHQVVLGRKLRLPEPSTGGSPASVSVEPMVSKIEQLRQSQTEKLQNIEQEIAQMSPSIQEMLDRLNQDLSDHEATHLELTQQEQALREQRRSLAELSGQLSLYEEMLQPQVAKLAELRQKLETAVASLNQLQETGDYQQQAIAQIRDVVISLVNPPSA
jgi:DNA repair exonuclease SbcCD ATPase subunit